MSTPDRETLRAQSAERWEQAATGWGRRADGVRQAGMPVSAWMIEHLGLQPGQRVLELAAGPGDTGFMAAELIKPGGTLVTSDASDGMLEVARARAAEQGIDNVEFKRLELEWIDEEAASVDAILCRWGIMLIVDPEAALREMRRVLKPGGRIAVAVWDEPQLNPWATTPMRALLELGFGEPPDPNVPGMFTLAPEGKLDELLASAGFTDIVVDAVAIARPAVSLEGYLAETLDLSRAFADAVGQLSEEQRGEVVHKLAELAEPYREADGELHFPGRSLVAAANA